MTSGVKWNEDYADPKSDVSRAGTEAFNGKNNPLLDYIEDAEARGRLPERNSSTRPARRILPVSSRRALRGRSLSDNGLEEDLAPFGMEQDAIWMLDKAGYSAAAAARRDAADLLAASACSCSAAARRAARISCPPAGPTRRPRTGCREAPPRPYGYFLVAAARWNAGYTAQGISGQGIAVFPELNLVIAMNSATPRRPTRSRARPQLAIVGAIVKAAMN